VPLALVALGANLGDRRATLAAAVRRLRAEPGVRVAAASAFYETAPVGGPPGQGPYLNAAVALQTDTSPEELLRLLHHIEHEHGRVRAEQDGPRTLDLDLLLYADVQVHDASQPPDLILPHPRLHERRFVLEPLAELLPDKRVPGLGATARELLARLPVPPNP
jgi:2-amino-4-hydroxy-6-hydroxymethyldihydropteridine diphosphokinase